MKKLYVVDGPVNERDARMHTCGSRARACRIGSHEGIHDHPDGNCWVCVKCGAVPRSETADIPRMDRSTSPV